jgi:ERF superfamily
MKELLKSLRKFHNECPPVTKEADNPFFKSKYATLDAIQEHIRPHLQKNGMVITQVNEVTGDGTPVVTTTVWHVDSGEFLESQFPIVVSKNTAQDYGSAVSYAKRYSLSGLLNLTIQDEDDDGNRATFGDNKVSVSALQPKTDDIKPWLNEGSQTWGKVVESLKNGYTMTDIRNKYKVSKAVEAKLMAAIAS